MSLIIFALLMTSAGIGIYCYCYVLDNMRSRMPVNSREEAAQRFALDGFVWQLHTPIRIRRPYFLFYLASSISMALITLLVSLNAPIAVVCVFGAVTLLCFLLTIAKRRWIKN